MGARDEILGKLVRRTKGSGATGITGHLKPAMAMTTGEEMVAQFRDKAAKLSCGLSELSRLNEVPGEIERVLGEIGVEPLLHVSNEPELASLPWEDIPGLRTSREMNRDALDGVAAVSACAAASAETGALVLTSDADHVTAIAFLPDFHFVVLRKSQIVPGFEGIWSAARARGGNRDLPRAVNIIGGPSRTGDIEATMVMGAHGPRHVHILLVDG
ncbi:L-lactate dehydrogenase complex protein LldG [Parvibaculum indicum]|uniref:LutC/YkgG family protein n=1 Tax=Parvibaculum indicum TaxID=562969 RepID=UPI00141E9B6E|nr:LUD domain-containing protein [Parvibaculum indicum]NIJ43249.1 L-lactate dehydrogenase complex protein LldG [Parvibaculum indicum]